MTKPEIVNLINTSVLFINQTAKLITDSANSDILSASTLANVAVFSLESNIETLHDIVDKIKNAKN